MLTRIRQVTIFILPIFCLVLFQNCSKVNFDGVAPSSLNANGDDGELPTSDLDGDGFGDNLGDGSFIELADGLLGGHFDLDTSLKTYDFDDGETERHIHEYDDKFGVTYADFLNLLDDKLINLQDAVPQDKNFIIVIANSSLSKGGVVKINEQSLSVVGFEDRVKAFAGGDKSALGIYNFSGVGATQLSDLKIGFADTAILDGGLLGTETGCVVKNIPGKLGEYRNGALTIQAIDADNVALEGQLGVAKIGPDSGLLWEATLFWHHDDDCYNE